MKKAVSEQMIQGKLFILPCPGIDKDGREVFDVCVEARLWVEVEGRGIFSAHATDCDYLIRRKDEYNCKSSDPNSEDFETLPYCKYHVFISPTDLNLNQ